VKHKIPVVDDIALTVAFGEGLDDQAVDGLIDEILKSGMELSPATNGLLRAIQKKRALAADISALLELLPRAMYANANTRHLLRDLCEKLDAPEHSTTSGETLSDEIDYALAYKRGFVDWPLRSRMQHYPVLTRSEKSKIEGIYTFMCRIASETKKEVEHVTVQHYARR